MNMNMNNHDYYETSAIKPSEAISMLAFCSSSSLPTGFSSCCNKNCSSSTDSGSSSSSSCDGSSHGSSSSQHQTKKVRFCTLEVRKYPTTIGEGRPSRGASVPALQMEWDHIEQTTTHIDAFERQRQHQRRHGEELLIDSITRGQILRSLGYSRDELRRVAMLTAIKSSSCYRW
jgi:hypothetical protein